MKKCRQAMENPTTCGKTICCFDCEDRTSCSESCSLESCDGCPDVIQEENQMVVFESSVLAITQTIANIATRKKELEDEDKKMREELEQAMNAYGVTSFENEYVKITHVEPSTKVSVDSAKLKKKYPEIYVECSKTSDVKGYVRISVK